ncbi:sigma-54-dependent transcriptional regulator [Sulfurirhabdus autotrophica]|uniref:Two-component system response regulator FlrC n=1 Tax=Sulfurirhabdus autotrophica TaxID=1706046 RepID=A0A4R3YJ99_9PROT|nr:sigma-54 dependent transcriptional regulator [Sulfurirhabdus autotrophica]TCV90783.1 two-component system response regulator FlrC [Sulfurirhabdus autotrophica]
MNALPILVVEDDNDLREALCDTLALAGYEALSMADGPSALELLQNQRVGLVLTDVQMKPMDGHTLLREIKARYPYVPVLMMTAYGLIEKAVEAMREGACNYLPKPFEPDHLLAEVARYMLPSFDVESGEVIGQDPRTVELLSLAQRVANTEATVMITGESGTGKEVLARFIHRHSSRADKSFVAINCAAIPENLLEATLFGYDKGSFTGASQAHAGKFEQAQEGTLLLDEISEMPLGLQAKLLRVLQEREVERVGGSKAIPLNIRVIATSNRDMADEVRNGRFREDLFYRLNVFPLPLPALRERSQDIIPLARHLMGRLASSVGRHGMVFSEDAERQLTQYSWPGNIRELENVIQRAMILAPGEVVECEYLYLPKVAVSEYTSPLAGNPVNSPSMDMKSLEKAHIVETLAAVKGSRKQAAERLGISERTLRYKLQQYREEDS